MIIIQYLLLNKCLFIFDEIPLPITRDRNDKVFARFAVGGDWV